MSIGKLVEKLPHPIMQCANYVYGALPPRIRYSKVFWETYNFLQESQWWRREKLEEYQMQQLSKILHHSYENVPYYRRVFDERGLKPKEITNFNDIRKLPYLTKEIIRENLTDLTAQNYPKSELQYLTTGGSTGIPLGFHEEKGISDAKEWAFMFTQWRRVKFKIGSKRAILKGNVVQSANKGKFWEYNPINKALILSSYHMTDQTLPDYVSKIRDFQPNFIHAYPSVIAILARFMKENYIEPLPSVKGILCASENLYPWQRSLFEEVFRCTVYSWYGHTEKAVLAGECEKSTYYHIFPEYGFVELIDENNRVTSKEDKMGEIVATGFNNYAMPFIRYRTGDLGVYTNQKCECGREYPLLQRVEGRLQELIVTKDKGFITLTGLIFGQHFEAFSRIKEMQLVQEQRGIVVIKLVKGPKYSDIDQREILSKIQKAVGDKLDVSFAYVDKIPRTVSGKHRFLIQKLPTEFPNIGHA